MQHSVIDLPAPGSAEQKSMAYRLWGGGIASYAILIALAGGGWALLTAVPLAFIGSIAAATSARQPLIAALIAVPVVGAALYVMAWTSPLYGLTFSGAAGIGIALGTRGRAQEIQRMIALYGGAATLVAGAGLAAAIAAGAEITHFPGLFIGTIATVIAPLPIGVASKQSLIRDGGFYAGVLFLVGTIHHVTWFPTAEEKLNGDVCGVGDAVQGCTAAILTSAEVALWIIGPIIVLCYVMWVTGDLGDHFGTRKEQGERGSAVDGQPTEDRE